MAKDTENKNNIETECDVFTPQELFLQAETDCCLCSHKLEFDHQVDFLNQQVIEIARCPICRIELKTRLNKLH